MRVPQQCGAMKAAAMLNVVIWGGAYSTLITGITYPNNTCTGARCYNEIHGIGACSDLSISGIAVGTVIPDEYSDTLINAYNNGKTGASPNGAYCYCKLINSVVASDHWVYHKKIGNASICASACAAQYSSLATGFAISRDGIFGAVPVPATTTE